VRPRETSILAYGSRSVDKYTCITAASIAVPQFDCNTVSRVGAVALYTVLWTVVVKYRKLPFSAPRRTKTPQPIKAKILTIHYVGGPTK
jgi:hypothetical protein